MARDSELGAILRDALLRNAPQDEVCVCLTQSTSSSAIAAAVATFQLLRLDRLQQIGDRRCRHLGKAGALDRRALGVVAELLQSRAGETGRERRHRRDNGLALVATGGARGAQTNAQDVLAFVGVR